MLAPPFKLLGRGLAFPLPPSSYAHEEDHELNELLLGHSGFNWWFSFVPVFNVVLLDTLRILWRYNTLFMSSPYLRFIIYLIRDLFVSFLDSLMVKETFLRTKCFKPLEKLRARVLI